MSSDIETGELVRIRSEYERRSREIPRGFYSWERPANFFLHVQTCRAAISALRRRKMFPLTGKAVADIGCGSGIWLMEFDQWDAGTLAGIDLDECRIERARHRLPSADLHAGDARRLPWSAESFDLVSQFTLFTSILNDTLKSAIAAEMLRVLKPGGLILWYDFRCNNPANPNVRGIGRREIRSLFPRCEFEFTSVTLAPPLARKIVAASWTSGLLLEAIPFLRTHYLAAIRKQIR